MGDWERPKADRLLAAHLRGELEQGRWSERMPGVIRLARELGVARNTVEAALRVLEEEGLLRSQGPGRGRTVKPVEAGLKDRLKVGILFYEPTDRLQPYVLDLLGALEKRGEKAVLAPMTAFELKHDVLRVARMVGEIEADAWVVVAGSMEVLEWFAAQPFPTFALFGRRKDFAMAGGGPDKVPAMRKMVGRLLELGHRRMVLFVRKERRKPYPGAKERAFLEELQAHGIFTGAYHLPDWEESPEGLVRAIDALYEITPPTALILDEGPIFIAAHGHLAQKGILVPRDVSLACCDLPGVTLDWVLPRMSHIRWKPKALMGRLKEWMDNVKLGRVDRRQMMSPAEFVEGGSIGPAPR